MDLQIIEHNNIRFLTTQQLATAYDTDSKTISNNFNNNKEKYIAGKHYICLEGADLQAFKNKSENLGIVGSKVNKLYLWTEKGCFLVAKSLNTDKAWEIYDRLVDEYFSIKQEVLNRANLSPTLQMVYALADSSAKIELEQKRQAEQIKAVETKLNNMQEIFTEPLGDWKADINKRVREISIKSGIDFQSVYNEMYGELETTAHCSLKRLQENKVNRMKKAGNTKTAINEGTTKIAIIYDKPHLKAIFEGIVKRWAMRYCA